MDNKSERLATKSFENRGGDVRYTIALIFSGLLISAATATERHVPSQYPNIKAAITASANQDIVVIAPGVYSGPENTNITISGKRIQIRGSDPANPEIVAKTLIDGGFLQAFSCILVIEGLTVINSNQYNGAILCNDSSTIIRNCVFEKFLGGYAISGDCCFLEIVNCTIRNNKNTHAISCSLGEVEMKNCVIKDNIFGGNVGCSESDLKAENCIFENNIYYGSVISAGQCKAQISNCRITGNRMLYNNAGGAIHSYGQLQIYNSIIKNNTAQTGGGISCDELEMSQCQIIGNIAHREAGGLEVFGKCRISSSVIAGNSAEFGSAIICHSDSAEIENCTIAENYGASYGQAIMMSNQARVNNSIIWGNFPKDIAVQWQPLLNYCDIDFEPNAGANNISIDPVFRKPGEWKNNVYAEGDYHISIESPCINAGDIGKTARPDEKDADDNARVRLGRIDIGAYEAKSHPMDFDEDGIMGFEDISRFCSEWLWTAKWKFN